MRPLPASAVVLTLALLGCTAGDPTGASGPRPTAARGGRTVVERPWSGRCDVASTRTGTATQRITGRCQLTHLGRVAVVTDETFTSATGGTNKSVYNAANGDLLYTTGTVAATFEPDGRVTLAGRWTVVGGTGRFAAASGTAAYAGAARFITPTTAEGAYTLDGRLAY